MLYSVVIKYYDDYFYCFSDFFHFYKNKISSVEYTIVHKKNCIYINFGKGGTCLGFIL